MLRGSMHSTDVKKIQGLNTQSKLVRSNNTHIKNPVKVCIIKELYPKRMLRKESYRFRIVKQERYILHV